MASHIKFLLRGQIQATKKRFKLAIFHENTKISVLEDRLSAVIASVAALTMI